MVVLNWRGFYIGEQLEGAVGQDDARFLALQFAAKLHELTISASLTAVILYYVRHQLTEESGLPFGAIVAGLQFKDVSYLWSMEFWGAVRANWRRKRDKTGLILLIVTCAVLALSAGPSSATLMRPRLDWWPAGGTDFWIASPPNELFSTNASATHVPASCMNDTGDLSCPSGGWQVIAQDYMFLYRSSRPSGYLPFYTYVSGEKAVRAITAFTRAPSFQFAGNQTQATVVSSSVADALVETGRMWAWAAYFWRSRHFHERYWSRIDVVYSVEAQQPIVHARCAPFTASDYTSRSTVAVYDLSDQDPHDSSYFGTLEYNYTDNEQVDSLIQNALNGGSVPQIAWATVPQSNGSALGATISVPLRNIDSSTLFQCTIAARMAPGTVQSTRNNVTLVTGADQNNIYNNKNTFPRISIDPAWAAYLNPTISSDNSTAYQYMMQVAGIFDEGSSLDADDIVCAIESLLATSVVNGLARRDFGVGFSGTLLGDTNGLGLVSYRNLSGEEMENWSWDCGIWCGRLLPSGYKMGYGGNAFNISDAQMAASTKFRMRAGAYGWAFNSRGSAAKFAMIALLIYVSIALSHLLYTLWTKESSSSWDSIAELLALAMRSEPSGALLNTGAGITTDEIFEQRTQVIDKYGSLQLAVGCPVGVYNLVDPNKEYG